MITNKVENFKFPAKKSKKFVSESYVKSIVVYPTETFNLEVFDENYIYKKAIKEEKEQMPCHFLIKNSGEIVQLIDLENIGDVKVYLDQDSWYICIVGGLNSLGKKEANYNEKQIESLNFLIKELEKRGGPKFKRLLWGDSLIAMRLDK